MRRLLATITVGTAILGGYAWAEGYVLDSGDTIRLHVFEWSDLSGDYTVNAQGQINLPMAVRVDARGLALDAVSDRIETALEERLLSGTPLILTVDMAEYRPFYVLGTEMGGVFEYRPGLTMLQAVAMAGGPTRVRDTTGGRIERDAINARGDMMLARSQLNLLRIRMARHQAELADENMFDLSEALDLDLSEPGVDEAIHTETLVFERRRGALEAALASIRRTIGLYVEELNSIKAQIESREDQIAIIEEAYESARSVIQRGLTTEQRETGLRLELAVAITLRRDLDTRIVQVRQNIERNRREIDEIIEAFNLEVLQAIEDTREAIISAESSYAIAQRLLSEALKYETTILQAGDADATIIQYFIQRQEDGAHQRIEANETTEIRPGDVIIVERNQVINDHKSLRLVQ